MANPIQKIDEAIAILDEIKNTFPLAEKWKDSIALQMDELTLIRGKLAHINEEVVLLEVKEKVAEKPKYLDIWKNLQPGVYVESSAAFKELLDNSKTLKGLYKKAIDMPSFVKFSDKEIGLARKIGATFVDVSDILAKIKKSIQNGRGTWDSKVRYYALDNYLFELLKNNGVIDYEVRISDFNKANRESKFIPLKQNELKYKNRENKIRFEFEFKDKKFYQFISGDWFNVYVYSIIDNHLKRNDFDYEICTKVTYKAPDDIMRDNGDFDIIAMVGNKILLAECKSGELFEEGGRYDFTQIIEKAEGIKQVFSSIGGERDYEYVFLLFYNPILNNPDYVAEQLKDTSILPVKPDEIRKTIESLFKKTI